MKIRTRKEFSDALHDGPYEWPGGYPKYFLMQDGEPLSFKSAVECRGFILDALSSDARYEQWRVVAVDVNWEDEDMRCVHSGELIECAYPAD